MFITAVCVVFFIIGLYRRFKVKEDLLKNTATTTTTTTIFIIYSHRSNSANGATGVICFIQGFHCIAVKKRTCFLARLRPRLENYAEKNMLHA